MFFCLQFLFLFFFLFFLLFSSLFSFFLGNHQKGGGGWGLISPYLDPPLPRLMSWESFRNTQDTAWIRLCHRPRSFNLFQVVWALQEFNSTRNSELISYSTMQNLCISSERPPVTWASNNWFWSLSLAKTKHEYTYYSFLAHSVKTYNLWLVLDVEKWGWINCLRKKNSQEKIWSKKWKEAAKFLFIFNLIPTVWEGEKTGKNLIQKMEGNRQVYFYLQPNPHCLRQKKKKKKKKRQEKNFNPKNGRKRPSLFLSSTQSPLFETKKKKTGKKC